MTHGDALRCMKEKSLQNFNETSAMTGFNVLEMFKALSKNIYLLNKHKIDKNVSRISSSFFQIDNVLERKGRELFVRDG